MKSLCLVLSLFLFGITGCIVESNRPANSTPETASSSTAPAASTTADPSSTAPQQGYPPPMHAAPGQ